MKAWKALPVLAAIMRLREQERERAQAVVRGARSNLAGATVRRLACSGELARQGTAWHAGVLPGAELDPLALGNWNAVLDCSRSREASAIADEAEARRCLQVALTGLAAAQARLQAVSAMQKKGRRIFRHQNDMALQRRLEDRWASRQEEE